MNERNELPYPANTTILSTYASSTYIALLSFIIISIRIAVVKKNITML
jgi:hypothetical protein